MSNEDYNYDDEYARGRDEGYDEGYKVGESYGYKDGMEQGNTDGYEKGYECGVENTKEELEKEMHDRAYSFNLVISDYRNTIKTLKEQIQKLRKENATITRSLPESTRDRNPE